MHLPYPNSFSIQNLIISSICQETTMAISDLQKIVALDYLAAFSTLDPTTFTALCTPTCTHTFLPSSMSIAPKSPVEFSAHIASLRKVLASFPVTFEEVFHDIAAYKVIVHATSETVFREEAKDEGVSEDEWRYRGEYMFVFGFEDEKISDVVEFVDSEGTARLRGLMDRARKNVASRAATEVARGH